jgi:hypothetical protein
MIIFGLPEYLTVVKDKDVPFVLAGKYKRDLMT